MFSANGRVTRKNALGLGWRGEKAGLGNCCGRLHFTGAAWEWQADGGWAGNQAPWLRH